MAGDKALLGFWDGHDAGAALVTSDGICCAINEERLTRRKLEVGFPSLSVKAMLKVAAEEGLQISECAVSTSDIAKTLTRYIPSLGAEYYQLRRRKVYPGALTSLKKRTKYWLTELPGYHWTEMLTRRILLQRLECVGLSGVPLSVVGHHHSHVAAAVMCSGYERCIGVSLDGIGDGLSGSLWLWQGGKLTPVAELSGKASFGLFFEHVTNLLNMRELEDEGKVMALADFAYPVPDKDNPLLSFFEVSGFSLRSRYSTLRMYDELKKVLWKFPAEQFAYLAQRVLEVHVPAMIGNAVEMTGQTSVAYAGGVAANIKVNRLIRRLPEVKDLFVFPHMGDGGLAAGAALARAQETGFFTHPRRLQTAALAPVDKHEDQKVALAAWPEFSQHQLSDPVSSACELLLRREVIFWFEGRMEYGPRALGQRSILALPDSLDIKNELNLRLKRRVWYQPFCPSMLEADAEKLLEDYDGMVNEFMTNGYMVRPEFRGVLQGVINVDGSCRPQILPEDSVSPYAELLKKLRQETGYGVVLNTSFNLHGEPLVCSVADALRTFAETDVRFMIVSNILVEKKSCEVGQG
ncbi:MAG: carbamoyltransferase C-terminal domain-containing protein [bacterium]|nr:carbamoyltransferase C-terminal domain-containing protein [bacterium]